MIDYKKIFANSGIKNILYDENLSKHTTFKIGGPCDIMIIPENEKEIIKAFSIIKDNNLDYMIIGNGSNLLVRDKGIRKVIIKIHDKFSKVSIDGEYVISQAGALLSKVAEKAMNHELTGMEFASGIPGDIGGAITMNAGAYGGEMKDIVEKVRVLNNKLEIIEYSNEEMNFRYRNSRVQDETLIVLEAILKLKKGKPEEIKLLYEDFKNRRESKQPLEYPSAGSTFKRPEGYYAGKLIDDSGLRGFRYKDAQVSEKHCGFIINVGNADFEQVNYVIKYIQNKVEEDSGVRLEPEVRIIGEE